MVTLTAVEFSYPDSDFLLQIPHLEVKRGERLAIVGASGSGKTSLLHLIAGLLTPQKGHISIAQSQLTSLNPSQRRSFRLEKIGLVFQEFELLEHLNCRENILLPFHLSSQMQLSQSVLKRLDHLATHCGLKKLLKKHPKQLSQGEKQRVAICRSLIGNPQIVLADEPTGNLDPTTKDHVMDLLFSSAEEIQATLIMVTHDHSLLKRFDRWIDFNNLNGGNKT